MDRRSLLAAAGSLYLGAAAGCVETLTGGRLADAVNPGDRTRQEGEVIGLYNDAVTHRNDGVATRNEGIDAFEGRDYEESIDRFETAIDHFDNAIQKFADAAALAYELGEEEAGSICENAEKDADLQIAATEAALNAAEVASTGGSTTEINQHIEEHQDLLERSESHPVEDPQTLADVIESG